MMSEAGVKAMVGGGGDGFNSDEVERDLNIYRSGSAPPTVEGSLSAIGGLFSGDTSRGRRLTDEELRSDPVYLSYYYSKVKLNPRLPPPAMSKEDWRFAQRLQTGSSAVGGIGDRRKVGRTEERESSSLFSMQPGFVAKEVGGEEDSRHAAASDEWLARGGDGLIGLPRMSIGRQKTFADLFQDDQRHKSSISGQPSRPTSRNAFDNNVELLRSSEVCVATNKDVSSLDGSRTSDLEHIFGAQNGSALTSPTVTSLIGSSISRSNSPDPQLTARAPSPHVPPIGVKLGRNDLKKIPDYLDRTSSGLVDDDDLIAALSRVNLSKVDNVTLKQSGLQKEADDCQNPLFNLQDGNQHINNHPFLHKFDSVRGNDFSATQSVKASFPDLRRNSTALGEFSNSGKRPHKQAVMQRSLSYNDSYRNELSASIGSPRGSQVRYPSNTDVPDTSFTSYGLNGCTVNALDSVMGNHIGASNLPPLFESTAAAPGFGSGTNWNPIDLQNFNTLGYQTPLNMPFLDPLYIQYLTAIQAATNYNEPSPEMASMGNSYAELLEMQKIYLGTLLQQQKQFGLPFLGKSGYYGNPAFSLGMPYPASPLVSPVLPASPVGPSSPLRHGVRNMHFPSSIRNFCGSSMGSWHLDNGTHMNNGYATSLLEEFKNNKAKCYELSDIAGHVVEFSADQYGSRFIQQKLETASTNEKDMFFEEIMPHAFSLMTDVFGNYVIQKFFEDGSAAQRRELANQLTGHVLALSLQMYGCRVIQKAIEVVDLDQQTKMVQELDGHVMRCVRDQNGNHVIQKCIECIPQDAIQFIISTFYGQVVTLSTHPYGCRVIQRILEYCDDSKTQQIMMDEIMQCVCLLAQDQYGNYVVQHVLEHGKPNERSSIIEKLTGQIVHMSQQKFASNVVEKCLTFAGPEERQVLVNEMLGTTEENEPLQAMMKDQFANYVVQKVLETCEDQQRGLILSRIKVHLNSLKKYTYGKHIVARVEKLVVAGERRLGVQSYS